MRAEIHHSHRDVTGGWLRPAVFGVMDGLVSNIALLSGVAGGHVSTHTMLLTGFAGLAAGSVSMATGEYVSVASQAELIQAEIEIEKAELVDSPEAEQAELAALYRARGLTPALATEVARQLSADPEQVWRVHAREELGVDPDDLPSPYLAAGSSFVAFAIGALVPLLPYFFGATTLLWSLVLTAVALFAAGTAVAALTVRSWVFAGSRQLALGVVAAAVSYGVGLAVGSAS
ncbi:MAG: vacuolar iron transporter family protein [Frankiales bacterium]|jgi:VIT1/CCC1 family predicted Fe2+/Mn2+ transporter|nr:vacuolar iron transporter family protein [Frankiales bacterium]